MACAIVLQRRNQRQTLCTSYASKGLAQTECAKKTRSIIFLGSKKGNRFESHSQLNPVHNFGTVQLQSLATGVICAVVRSINFIHHSSINRQGSELRFWQYLRSLCDQQPDAIKFARVAGLLGRQYNQATAKMSRFNRVRRLTLYSVQSRPGKTAGGGRSR